MAVVLAAILAVSAVGVFFLIDHDEEVIEDSTLTANVYIDSGTDTPYMAEGTGKDIVSIINDSAGEIDILFNSNGSVRSVDGRIPGEGERWVIWRWASPEGWSVLSGTGTVGLPDGVNLCVHMSKTVQLSGGVVSYEPPEIEIEYRIYFFIQLREQYSANEWIRSAIGSEMDRRDGQWFSATGTSVMDAFEKVVWGEIFTGQYTVEERAEILNYRTVPSQLGWLDTFMGWNDTRVGVEGEYGTWTYWSQYNWTENAGWEYDNLSLGKYDITDHRYFALILQTTLAHDTGSNYPQEYPSDIREGI